VIFGIGIDVVRLDRMERAYRRFGQRFVDRLLLPREMSAFQTNKRPARFLAMRFAAKEAVVKAMGTGFRHGMWIRDAGVVQNEWGRPEIIWSSRGAAMRDRLGIGEGHISLTDEAGLVVAVAVLLRAQS
jgi:holo-[acyl-carrier protein] synthase